MKKNEERFPFFFFSSNFKRAFTNFFFPVSLKIL